MSAPRTGSLLWTLALLVGLAIVSWSLFHWLTVERPDRSRLISDSAVYADQGRSLMREQVYMDRLVTPVQVVLFRSGPPHPAASWAPLYPALVGMWFGAHGATGSTAPIVINALGFLAALIALYALGGILVGRALAWLPPFLLLLHPRLLALANDGLTEGWFTAFLLLTLVFLLMPGRAAPQLAAAGLMFAMAELTRVNAVTFAPVLIILAAVPIARGERKLAYLERGAGAVLLFVGLFVLMLMPWLFYRLEVFGSPFFELQRFNLLNNLGPWNGSDAYRSIFTPDPVAHILHNPFEYLGKVLVGLVKSAFLMPLRYLNPLEFGLVVVGCVAMLRRPAQRVAIVIILALQALQVLVGSATLLDPRIWQPIGVLLWIPLAVGIRAVAGRLLPEWRGIGMAMIVLVVAVLPFAATGLGHYLEPDLGDARMTEEEAGTLGDWTALMVPDGEAVLTDYEELVWYADRSIVWLPYDPTEVAPLRALSQVRYALWQEGEDDEMWLRYFDQQLAAGAMRRVGELRMNTGVFVVGRWD